MNQSTYLFFTYVLFLEINVRNALHFLLQYVELALKKKGITYEKQIGRYIFFVIIKR